MSVNPHDHDVDDVLSAAVVEYFGINRSSYPRPDRAAVAARFPDRDIAPLLERVVALEVEMGRIKIDWATLGWQQGCDVALATMRQRHPELSIEALTTLDWQFSYSTR